MASRRTILPILTALIVSGAVLRPRAEVRAGVEAGTSAYYGHNRYSYYE